MASVPGPGLVGEAEPGAGRNFGPSGMNWFAGPTVADPALVIVANSGAGGSGGQAIGQTGDAAPSPTVDTGSAHGTGESGVLIGNAVVSGHWESGVGGTSIVESPGMPNSVGGVASPIPVVDLSETEAASPPLPGTTTELVGDPGDPGGPMSEFIGRPFNPLASLGRAATFSNSMVSPSLLLGGAFVEANRGLSPATESDDSSTGLIQGKGLLDYAAGREMEMMAGTFVPLTILSAGLDSNLVREATLGDLSTGDGLVGRSSVFGEGRLRMAGPLSAAAIDEVLAIAKVGKAGIEEPVDATDLAQPVGADLIGGLLPFQSESIQRVVDQFVNELEELRAGEAILSRPRNVVVLTSAALGTIAAAEVLRRRMQTRPRANVRSGGRSGSSGSETIGFPELPGSWSTRYT
jgi:hypothetical protein